MTSTPLEIAMGARNYINTPAKWTKNVQARNKYGNRVALFGPSVARMCIAGAIQLAAKDAPYSDKLKVIQTVTLAVLEDHNGGIENFNDSKKTKHSDVMVVMDRAIEMLKKEEVNED